MADPDRDPAPGSSPPPGGFRTFLLLWSTQTLSLFGTVMTWFAVNVWLTREVYPAPGQKAALALGLTATTVALTAPMILLMPIAGAFADRHDRRRTMLIANLASTAITAALLALVAAQRLSLGPAVALLAAYAAAASFHNASFDSGYALLVPQPQLARATALMQTSYALSQLLSPGLAAALIAVPALARAGGWPAPWLTRLASGVPFAFGADGVTFAIAAAALLFVRLPAAPRAAGAPRRSLWGDVHEGLAWILRRPPMLWLIGIGSLANLTIAPLMVLLPVLVRDRLGLDLARHHLAYEAGLAIANTAAGLGGVAGGVLVSVWGGLRTRRVHGMVLALVCIGLGELASGLATTLVGCAAGLMFADLFVPFLNSSSFTLWQGVTPPAMLGRALAVRRFIAQSAYPVGTAIAGWLAVGIAPWRVVSAAGALLAVACALQLALPGFATLEQRMLASAAAPPADPVSG
ncbi:MAG TPA: MFS transporter [Candidatus Eisenbacteria bacterium]|nr:MFS transporter [Candidatus Eisenbacteria bacterium]